MWKSTKKYADIDAKIKGIIWKRETMQHYAKICTQINTTMLNSASVPGDLHLQKSASHCSFKMHISANFETYFAHACPTLHPFCRFLCL